MTEREIMFKAAADVRQDRDARRVRIPMPDLEATLQPQIRNEVAAPDLRPLAQILAAALAKLPDGFGRIKISPAVTNEVAAPNMQPVAEAIDRQTYALAEAARPSNVAVESPVTVTVDMTPVAEAMDRQTVMFGKMVAALEKIANREIEIIKDKDGKPIGARRK